MSSKLSSANPYMRDPVVRRSSVLRSVATSSAIDGIRAPFKAAAVKLAKRTSPVPSAHQSAKR